MADDVANSMPSHRILCVDPDEDARQDTVERLRTELTEFDPVFETAATLDDATTAVSTDLAAVVTEYDLADGTGLELVTAVRDTAPDAGCILYTDAAPDAISTDELRGTITEYVGKGSVFGTERLARLLQTTVEGKSQASYPLPQNERERLAALQSYDLDDRALLESLDRITDLAATHFSVERASINIISEHSQDFLACYGGANEWDTMDRQDSICTFTIVEDDDVLAVEDVTEDPRFESRSDTLLDMGIRAYLGANLVTRSGLVIGPLCIYDDEPRSFSAADEAYLRDLAAVAMDVIELHARLDGGVETDGEEP
ncbi:MULTISPECIES: GAF domain-containing protein [Halomicrobium]|nr:MULTISPECIES: GAF domain-containing protein [Halomicrobium]